MFKYITSVATVVYLSSFLAVSAMAETVTMFQTFPSAGVWGVSDNKLNGTSSIVSVSGLGGNLETAAPLGTGVAKLTTSLSVDDKAEVSVKGNFGTMGDFIANGSVSYDFFKAFVPGGNAAAAASIKLTIFDVTNVSGDGYGTFVFEPYFNSTLGSVPTGQWLSEILTGTIGNVWHTGLYGQDNQGGGGAQSLTAWLGVFGNTLNDATIVAISVGVGTDNAGQEAYFDNIQFRNGEIVKSYDFDVAPVPVPAALPLFGSGLALLGFFGWRKKRKALATAAA